MTGHSPLFGIDRAGTPLNLLAPVKWGEHAGALDFGGAQLPTTLRGICEPGLVYTVRTHACLQSSGD